MGIDFRFKDLIFFFHLGMMIVCNLELILVVLL
jgi:hypothetical protein